MNIKHIKRLLDSLVAIKIDDHTSLYKKGRDEYVYEENEKKVLIYAELTYINDEIGVEIDAASITQWLPPHQDALLTDNDRQRILMKFCEHLKSRKIIFTMAVVE